MMRYTGSCHCGAIRFTFEDEPLTAACRCNCSLCRRRGALMSARYYPRDAIAIDAAPGALAVYQWGDRMMNHYFCARCGVFPFSDVIATGQHRVNLGCVDGLDLGALAVTELDGASF